MKQTSSVHARLDSEIKARSESVLRKIGMTPAAVLYANDGSGSGWEEIKTLSCLVELGFGDDNGDITIDGDDTVVKEQWQFGSTGQYTFYSGIRVSSVTSGAICGFHIAGTTGLANTSELDTDPWTNVGWHDDLASIFEDAEDDIQESKYPSPDWVTLPSPIKDKKYYGTVGVERVTP